MCPFLTALAAAALTTLRVAPVGKWSALRIKLSCVRKAGGDLSGLSSPASLTTGGKLPLSVSSVRLIPKPGGAGCP